MAKTNGRTKKANIEKTLEKILEKAITPPREKNTPQKSVYWEFILYPDCPRHLEYYFDIKQGKYPTATGCVHDRDYTDPVPESWDSDGNYIEPIPSKPKKTHAHIIVKLPYSGTKGSVERLFPNLESHLIIKVDCADERYRYLIHMDDPKKHRYSPNDVFGNTENFYQYYHTEATAYEGAEICRILDILDNWDYSQGKPTYSKVIRLCAEMGLYGYLRKGGVLLSQVIKETIDGYTREYTDVRWLEDNYIKNKQADEIWRLNSALKSANNTIETYKKLVK